MVGNKEVAIMWKFLAITAMLSLLLGSSGCETTSHAEEGAVIGGVLGGIAGSQVGGGSGRTAAIIVGAIAGSMIGRHVGQTMDESDRMKTALALNDNRTGQSATWINPDTGNEYVVTPTRTYDSSSGPCREFTLLAEIGGKQDQPIYGTACLQPDGSWKIVQ